MTPSVQSTLFLGGHKIFLVRGHHILPSVNLSIILSTAIMRGHRIFLARGHQSVNPRIQSTPLSHNISPSMNPKLHSTPLIKEKISTNPTPSVRGHREKISKTPNLFFAPLMRGRISPPKTPNLNDIMTSRHLPTNQIGGMVGGTVISPQTPQKTDIPNRGNIGEGFPLHHNSIGMNRRPLQEISNKNSNILSSKVIFVMSTKMVVLKHTTAVSSPSMNTISDPALLNFNHVPLIFDRVPPIFNHVPLIFDRVPPIFNHVPLIFDRVPPIFNHVPLIFVRVPPIFNHVPLIFDPLSNLILIPTEGDHAILNSRRINFIDKKIILTT
jgi:hypothetical protein